MIAGFDSSFDVPTRAQLRSARAAGVGIWWGYFGSRDGLGLATRWQRESFQMVQEEGLRAGGFCSGWDDPDWIRETAVAWGILASVDVERGIRDDGPWVHDWVTRARTGLYGLASVHVKPGEPRGRGALFNIVARYPGGDPRATWDPAAGPRPPAPCGWQSRGTHTEFGVSCDSGWYDDWFAGAAARRQAGGEGLMLRIPGPAPGSFHIFGISAGRLVRASALPGLGGLGGLEHWLAQPGDGWVVHSAPPGGLSLVPGSLAGDRGLDGNGADRLEVHALASDGHVWTLGVADDGREVLPWEPLIAPKLDVGIPGPPGPDVRPAVAAALTAAVDQLKEGN